MTSLHFPPEKHPESNLESGLLASRLPLRDSIFPLSDLVGSYFITNENIEEFIDHAICRVIVAIILVREGSRETKVRNARTCLHNVPKYSKSIFIFCIIFLYKKTLMHL